MSDQNVEVGMNEMANSSGPFKDAVTGGRGPSPMMQAVAAEPLSDAVTGGGGIGSEAIIE